MSGRHAADVKSARRAPGLKPVRRWREAPTRSPFLFSFVLRLLAMTNRKFFSELAHSAVMMGVLKHGETAIDYVRRGKPIPEYLLPGRFIMKQAPSDRERLKELTSDETVCADWYVKAWVITA